MDMMKVIVELRILMFFITIMFKDILELWKLIQEQLWLVIVLLMNYQ